MASSTFLELRTRLRSDLRDEAAEVFTDSDLLRVLNLAIGEYSRVIPQELEDDFPMDAGVEKYGVPASMLQFVSLIDEDGNTYRISEVFGDRMIVSPMPLANHVGKIRMLAVHGMLTDANGSTSTYRSVDDELILLRARALCLDMLASESARFYQYTEGDIAENRGQSQKQLREEADRLTALFNQKLAESKLQDATMTSIPATRVVAGVVKRAADPPVQSIYKP